MEEGFAMIAVGIEHDFGAQFCGLHIGDGGYVAQEMKRLAAKKG